MEHHCRSRSLPSHKGDEFPEGVVNDDKSKPAGSTGSEAKTRRHCVIFCSWVDSRKASHGPVDRWAAVDTAHPHSGVLVPAPVADRAHAAPSTPSRIAHSGRLLSASLCPAATQLGNEAPGTRAAAVTMSSTICFLRPAVFRKQRNLEQEHRLAPFVRRTNVAPVAHPSMSCANSSRLVHGSRILHFARPLWCVVGSQTHKQDWSRGFDRGRALFTPGRHSRSNGSVESDRWPPEAHPELAGCNASRELSVARDPQGSRSPAPALLRPRGTPAWRPEERPGRVAGR